MCLLNIWLGEYSAAMKLIYHARSVKGTDHVTLLYLQAMIYEYRGELKIAKRIIKKAMVLCIDNTNMQMLENVKARLKKKMKMM